MLLEDKMLVDGTVKRIKEARINAEGALKETIAAIGLKFDTIEDEYLRERKHDVEQVGERILRNLVGHRQESLADIKDEAVIIAHDLAPSDTLMMRKDKILGFATDAGSRTSHTAILARSLGIPAAVGLENITAAVKTGDVVILDGIHGVVIVDPDEETFLDYLKKQRRYKYFEQELEKIKEPARGNARRPRRPAAGEHRASRGGRRPSAEHGGTGIGLYRTEFLFMNRSTLPTEEEHYKAYRHVAEKAAPHEVVIRTLDVGGDKIGIPAGSKRKRIPPWACGPSASAFKKRDCSGPSCAASSGRRSTGTSRSSIP